MTLTLDTGADLIASDAFQRRVAAGFFFVAREVFIEDATTPGHENRERFARSIIFKPYEAYLQFAAAVATDAAVVSGGPYTDPATGPTDAVILTAIRDMWNVLSHVQI